MAPATTFLFSIVVMAIVAMTAQAMAGAAFFGLGVVALVTNMVSLFQSP